MVLNIHSNRYSITRTCLSSESFHANDSVSLSVETKSIKNTFGICCFIFSSSMTQSEQTVEWTIRGSFCNTHTWPLCAVLLVQNIYFSFRVSWEQNFCSFRNKIKEIFFWIKIRISLIELYESNNKIGKEPKTPILDKTMTLLSSQNRLRISV